MGKLGAVYAGSRLVGLARELAVAYALGTTVAADRVSGAFVIASAAGFVLGEAIFAGAVSRIGGTNDPAERARRYAQVFREATRVALISLVAYIALGSVATVALLDAWGAGFEDTILLAILLAPSVAAYVLSGAINARLTIERRFLLLNGVQVLYSAGAITLLLLTWTAGLDLKAQAVVAGWSLGNVAALGVLLALAKPEFAAGAGRAIQSVMRAGAPLAVGSALLVGQSVTNRAVAARLDTGDVAALGYADRLFLLPVGFVLAVVGPIVLGALTVAAADALEERPGADIADQLQLIAKVAVPVALGFAAVAPLAIPALFEYGAFTASSTDHTVEALNGLAAGLAAISMVLVLVRVLQATRRYRTLLVLTAGAAAGNLIASSVGAVLLGLGGVALGTSMVAAVTVWFGMEILGAKFGPEWRRHARRHATLPIVACTGTLTALVIAEELQWLSQTVRILALGGAAAVVGAVLLQGRALTRNRYGESRAEDS